VGQALDSRAGENLDKGVALTGDIFEALEAQVGEMPEPPLEKIADGHPGHGLDIIGHAGKLGTGRLHAGDVHDRKAATLQAPRHFGITHAGNDAIALPAAGQRHDFLGSASFEEEMPAALLA
jgi:hypothetical protein